MAKNTKLIIGVVAVVVLVAAIGGGIYFSRSAESTSKTDNTKKTKLPPTPPPSGSTNDIPTKPTDSPAPKKESKPDLSPAPSTNDIPAEGTPNPKPASESSLASPPSEPIKDTNMAPTVPSTVKVEESPASTHPSAPIAPSTHINTNPNMGLDNGASSETEDIPSPELASNDTNEQLPEANEHHSATPIPISLEENANRTETSSQRVGLITGALGNGVVEAARPGLDTVDGEVAREAGDVGEDVTDGEGVVDGVDRAGEDEELIGGGDIDGEDVGVEDKVAEGGAESSAAEGPVEEDGGKGKIKETTKNLLEQEKNNKKNGDV